MLNLKISAANNRRKQLRPEDIVFIQTQEQLRHEVPVYSAVAGFKRFRNIELIDIICSLESVGERTFKNIFV